MNLLNIYSAALSCGSELLSEETLDFELSSTVEHCQLSYSYAYNAEHNAFFCWCLFEDLANFRTWSSTAAYLNFLSIKDSQTDEMLNVLCSALMEKQTTHRTCSKL